MPETSATASTLANRLDCYVCHAVFVEGIPYFWTDDETGELLGSGASSWIGASEDAITGEVVGQRIGLPGLRMPRQLRESLDPKTGLLLNQNVTLRLVDYRGILADLFASEGKAFDTLAEDVQPGNSALGTSVAIAGGLTVNPRGRYLGIERIGPSGQRSFFSPFPFALVGRHHAVNLYGQGEEGPRPVPISVEPLDFTRRKVAIYRFVRRRLPEGTGYTAWPLWDEQYEADPSALVWWGELTDRGTIAGNREWDLKCYGASSWLQKTLNQNAPGWRPITNAPIVLTEEQRQVALEFHHTDETGVSDGLDYSVGFRTTLTASGDADTWRAEIAALIASVASGSTFDYGTPAAEDFEGARFGILNDGTFWAQRNHYVLVSPEENQRGVMMIPVMHEIVWRALGYDPPLQAYGERPFTEETQIAFKSYDSGERFGSQGAVDDACPAPGFWSAAITSIGLGFVGEVGGYLVEGADNNGHPRRWRPINSGQPLILRGPQFVPQQIQLPVDQPYLEATPTVQWTEAEIEATPVDSARYFAIRGKRAVGSPVGAGVILDPDGNPVQLEDVEAEDYATIVKCDWVGSSYGSILESGGSPTLSIARYMDGRIFGVKHGQIDGEWSALAIPGDPGLEIAPLLTYGYGEASMGRAIECFYQLFVSTGSASGWTGPESDDPPFLFGDNSHTGQDQHWCGDALKADHALAIPSELVASPDETFPEWDRVPGGAGGPLSRIGLAYVGPVESMEIVQSILRPRALSLSLDGGRYGVVYLAPFSPEDATVQIGEADLYGEQDDPASVIPKQDLRAVGQLDRVEIGYRWDPVADKTAEEQTYRARDREAQARRGDLKLELEDHGLVPQNWDAPGVDAWEFAFRELWEIDRSQFFARRHFLVRDLRVNRIVGARCRVGTRVLLTNPWPVNPAGGYGLTAACGIVTEWDYDPARKCYTLAVLVFAGQFDGQRLFMPVGRVASTSGAAITLEAEDEATGISGASRFARPTWAASLNQARVVFVSHDRLSWTVSSAYTVSSVAGNVVTLTGTPTAADVYRDRDVYLVMADQSEQTGRWPSTYGSIVVLDTHSHPGGAGAPLEP